MSRCGFSRFVIDYADGVLDPGKRETFQRHLDACPSCQRECAEHRKVIEIMSLDEVPLPDSNYFEDLKVRVRQTPEKKKPLRWWVFPAALVPAAAAAVFVFVLIGEMGKARDTVEISVDMSGFMHDADVSRLVLSKIVDNDLTAQFEELEDYVTTDIDENIGEMSETERSELVKKLNEKYGKI
ncbi:MAG TPA: zf-HC2 domain-containing protein [bacterium]